MLDDSGWWTGVSGRANRPRRVAPQGGDDPRSGFRRVVPKKSSRLKSSAPRGAQQDLQSFAAHVSERVLYGIDRFLPLGARPVEDGDAFRPRTASDIARPQYVHSTLTPGFARCAQTPAIASGRLNGLDTPHRNALGTTGHSNVSSGTEQRTESRIRKAEGGISGRTALCDLGRAVALSEWRRVSSKTR
jgi:hypothetical protein